MRRKLTGKISIFLFLFILTTVVIVAKANWFSVKKKITQTNIYQPYLYHNCLTDNAKLNNYYHPKFLLKDISYPNFSEMKVSPHKRCSAQFALLNFEAYDLPRAILQTAMKAYHHARLLGLDSRQLLTIVDYVKPSNENRLWVLDLNTDKILFHTLVSHGARTGALYAKYFSNRINSYESSLGVILTGKAYNGIEGYSMRLHGLEKGFDNHIYEREIVMHPAYYVSQAFVRKYHAVGKSFGCLAVGKSIARRLINTIKNGTIIVDYFPSRNWLQHSRFLH